MPLSSWLYARKNRRTRTSCARARGFRECATLHVFSGFTRERCVRLSTSNPEELGRKRVARIESVLGDAFAPTVLRIEDESHQHRGHAGARGGGGHFNVTIVSEAFRDRNRVSRHRMVYDVLRAELGSEIHALSVKAMTDDEAPS
ncbi:MAG: BolA family transcriptional regulator [bacterium]|nr:BolA family transcriptional regulator [bacterium]